MKASTLRKRIFIAKNKLWYEPTIQEIKQRYKQKYMSLEAPKVSASLPPSLRDFFHTETSDAGMFSACMYVIALNSIM
jgi:hypothetical protein